MRVESNNAAGMNRVGQAADAATTLKTSAVDSVSNRLESFLEVYQQQWQRLEHSSSAMQGQLSPQLQNVFRLQREVSEFSLQTELLVRAVDGASGALKKMQQLQG